MRDGDQLRLVGAGGPGSPAGDLLLVVAVEARRPESPIWREDDDVHIRLPVTWHEALRRGRFRLVTPWAIVETELPESVAIGGAELVVDDHGVRSPGRPWGRLVAHVELRPPTADPLVLAYLELAQGAATVRVAIESLLLRKDVP